MYSPSAAVLAVSDFDVAYMAAMAVLPGLVAWLVWVPRPGAWSARRVVRAMGWLALGGGPLGLVAGSPPVLRACATELLGAVPLVGWMEGRRALHRTAISAAVLVAVCAYWAVPFALELTSSTVVSTASHRSWQWTATRSTLANSFWLNRSWDQADRAVLPYAWDLHHFPPVLWRSVVPVVVFASAGVAGWPAPTRHDQQRIRRLVAVMALVLVLVLGMVVLATGARAPGAAPLGLLTAVPFGSLVEDPWRFLLAIGAAYAVLVTVLFNQREARRPGTGPEAPWVSN